LEEDDESAFPPPGEVDTVEDVEVRKEDVRLESTEPRRERAGGGSADGS
jgi:hypothetical protein